MSAAHEDSAHQALARRILAAQRGGTALAPFGPGEGPADMEAAYDLQDRVAALRGGAVAGFKLGLASPAAKRAAGLAEALVGRCAAERVFSSGADLPCPAWRSGIVEVEVALRLGRDIAPGEAPADPLDAADAAFLAFEIVGSRFPGGAADGLPGFVADDSGFGFLVVGAALPGGARSPLLDAAAILEADGAPVAGPFAGDDRVSPRETFAELLAWAARRGLSLSRGQLVSTGSLTVPWETRSPARIVGRLGEASVEARLDFAQ